MSRLERDVIGTKAVDLGIIGVDSELEAMTYYIDPNDTKRVGIVTYDRAFVLNVKHLKAMMAELPEIFEMYA